MRGGLQADKDRLSFPCCDSGCVVTGGWQSRLACKCSISSNKVDRAAKTRSSLGSLRCHRSSSLCLSLTVAALPCCRQGSSVDQHRTGVLSFSRSCAFPGHGLLPKAAPSSSSVFLCQLPAGVASRSEFSSCFLLTLAIPRPLSFLFEIKKGLEVSSHLADPSPQEPPFHFLHIRTFAPSLRNHPSQWRLPTRKMPKLSSFGRQGSFRDPSRSLELSWPTLQVRVALVPVLPSARRQPTSSPSITISRALGLPSPKQHVSNRATTPLSSSLATPT